jgi:hypothetical protein
MTEYNHELRCFILLAVYWLLLQTIELALRYLT